MNEGGNNVLTTVGIVAGLVIAYKGYSTIKDWRKEAEAKDQLKKDQASIIKVAPGKKLFDLMGKPIKSANIANIASDIESGTSYPTDQQRVLRAFKSTPFGHVKELEDFYLDKYKEPLRERLVSRLSDANWISIKFLFDR